MGSKAYETEQFYIDGSVQYQYYGTRTFQNSSSSNGIRLFSVDSRFTGHIFLINTDIYTKLSSKFSDYIDIGVGLGLGLAGMRLEQNVILNQANWTWPSSLQPYDNSTFTYTGSAPVFDISFKTKFKIKRFSIIGMIGYRFLKVSGLESDPSNYQSNGANYKDANGQDLEFDFGGRFIGVSLFINI